MRIVFSQKFSCSPSQLKISSLLFLKTVAAFVIISFMVCGKAIAQDSSENTKVAKRDSVEQLDAADIIKKWFHINIGSKLDTSKIPPGKLLLSFAPAAGYTVVSGTDVVFVSNISFYSGNQDSTNLSAVSAAAEFSIRKQIIIPVISNIWTRKNKYDLLGDWRYYKYPSYTYGLGSSSSLSNIDLIDYSYVKVYQEVLRHFDSNFYIGIGYNLDYHYNITNNSGINDFRSYGDTAAETTSSGPVVRFIYDSRTNINNPKDAFYASVIYRDNLTAFGSSRNWQSVEIEARKYFKLSPRKVLAFWSWNVFTFDGKAPYLDLPSNGWDTYNNTGRGYIQGRFRGPDMIYGEAELRFGLTRNGLLGGVVFANAETVSDWPQKQFDEIFPASGFGLRVKFNKYSDVNICIDYGVGINGSNGIFFNLGEVF
jgi:hypothetical protein